VSDKLFNISLKGDLMLRLYELARKYRELDASQALIIEFALDYVADNKDFHQFLREKLEQEPLRRAAEEAREKKAHEEAHDAYVNKLDKLEAEFSSGVISSEELESKGEKAAEDFLDAVFDRTTE
jgi:hypothetical protein